MARCPHETRDPIPAAVSIVQAIQTIVSRNHHALGDLVVSVFGGGGGDADPLPAPPNNVIPGTAFINGTVRTLRPRVQSMVIRRMEEIVAGQGASFGVAARLDYAIGYPATINDVDRAAFAAEVAAEVVGRGFTSMATRAARLGRRDFAYMLQARPGAYLFLGAGPGAGLPHPKFDFNDEILPVGASLLARLAERALPIGG